MSDSAILPKIMIGMPVGSGMVPWATATALSNTLRACDREKLPVRVCSPVGSSAVAWARSFIAGEFLKSDFTHLFWIDADMVWTPADFFRLVGFGAAHDLIGATYTLKREPLHCVVNVPTPGEYEINRFGNVRVKSLALGFTIVKREVIERLSAEKPILKDSIGGHEYADLFRFGRRDDGTAIGEDVMFFEEAAELGYRAWLDPSINLGHVGLKTYQCDVIDALELQDLVKEKQQ